MKIQLDYDNKVVTIENDVNLGDFVDRIQELLPEWDKWNLNTQTIINNWQNPIVIDRYIPNLPWWEHLPTIVSGPVSKTSLEGKHNLEITY